MVELHTGAYCLAVRERRPEAARLLAGAAGRRARRPRRSAWRSTPATASTTRRSAPIAAIPEIAELNIGHFLIGEAIFTGLDPAIRRMRALMDAARRRGGGLIIGLGSDLADIRRIEATLERFGERFVARIFTDVERARSERKADRAASYAKRFAAKEACAKALGTGLRAGVFWRDMGVVNARSGAPTWR